MNVEPRPARQLRQRLPNWRWLYGGGVWAVAVTGVSHVTGLNQLIGAETSPAGRLSASGRLILGLTLIASLLLGGLVQRLWPSSLAYRLFAPAISLALITLAIVLPFGQAGFDGDSFVGIGMFLAWLAGVVLADPVARIKPAGLLVASRSKTA